MPKIICFVRYISFCLFFAIGILAIAMSILAEEIGTYYSNLDAVAHVKNINAEIKTKITESEMQIAEAEKNPEIIERLKRVTFGLKLEAEDTAFPKASRRDLEQAAREILESAEKTQTPTAVKQWVYRCQQPKIRLALFLAGAGLILINFIFFTASTPTKNLPQIQD
jgi:hypothetical protein